MKELNNPFVVYGYKGAEYFCDRVAETEKIITGLSNERNVTVIAPRRIGKTGLIHHVFSQIRERQPEICCIYFDVLPTKTLEQFVQLMARRVLGRLDSPTQSALRKVQDFFSAFRPTMTFDVVTGLPTFSLDIGKSQEAQSLQRIFEYIRQSGKRCYIAIDEFQQIARYAEADTEALLRSFIQFVPNAYFLFAGSQQHMMSDMFLSPERPLYQGAQMVAIKEIAAPVYHDFASGLFRSKGRQLPSPVFDRLYCLVDGQTWYVQAILNRVYASGVEVVADPDVDAAIDELIDEQEVAFENYYSSLTTNQAALLLAIAKERRVTAPMSQDFAAKHHLPAASSIKTALASLADAQFVSMYQKAYVVYDRFFGRWLRERLP